MHSESRKDTSSHSLPARKSISSEILHHRLTAYAAALAGVAGVSVAVLAQEPAPPHHIRYTPASIPLTEPGGTPVPIDLNHDGITDFILSATGISQVHSGHGFSAHGSIFETPAAGNFAIGSQALPAGKIIDKGGEFQSTRQKLAWARFSVYGSTINTDSSGGPFKNEMNKYLGVKFQIHGETHEGWIRLTISCNGGFVSGTITGYAYDTYANEVGLKAGQLFWPEKNEKNDKEEAEKPATLGMLSVGAAAVPYWRR